MRVMIVDDDLRAALTLSRCLQESGHQVIQYASAPEAVRGLIDAPCDICLLDTCLPGVDSHFAVRVFGEVAPGMPVILLGGEASAAEEAALRAGAALVLRKPVAAEALREVLGVFARSVGEQRGRVGGEGPSGGREAPPPPPGP